MVRSSGSGRLRGSEPSSGRNSSPGADRMAIQRHHRASPQPAMNTGAQRPVAGERARPEARRERRLAREAKRNRRRLSLAVVVVSAAVVVPALYSYASAMMKPSSLPLGVRSVDWVRTHHGAWFVNEVERLYYTWTAPSKGGPPLRTLPTVGKPISQAPPPRVYYPPRITPLMRPVLPGEGVWRSTGRVVDGAAAGAGDDVPDRPRLSADRRLRRLVRPHADAARSLPRPLRAAGREPARADGGATVAALAPARRVQQRVHAPRQ